MRLTVFTPTRLKRSMERAFFCSTAADKWEGMVSMVQGASRGIGLEFVKQLLKKNDEGHVIATCRNPNQATGLLDLKNKFLERLSILPLDVTKENTIEAAATTVKESFGKLNLLINASGILSIPDVLQPETTLSKVQKSSLLLAYEVNAIGPILVIKHMSSLLKAGGGFGIEKKHAIIASLSARVGSIGDNGLGGWHSYRASKTALNQLTKTISVEFGRKKDPIVCILLHPGTVDTDLSRPFQRNVPPVIMENSSHGMVKRFPGRMMLRAHHLSPTKRLQAHEYIRFGANRTLNKWKYDK
ncbi:uncharacterized protein LOC141824516 isoform X2 [Curcuma longa]|uniref:uncharacterized protein LOC141824516 isoform X2 n=1 Tax=Curcuma longa TaxID=136217 RepID=UPI003D9F665E